MKMAHSNTKQLDKAHCDQLRAEIGAQKLYLRDASGGTQLATLPKVLAHLGNRGLGTAEGEALGYRRIATRITDLIDRGYKIDTVRETVVMDDGLPHYNMARYFLIAYPQSTNPDKPLSPPGSDSQNAILESVNSSQQTKDQGRVAG